MLQLWVQSYDFILRFSHSSLRNIVCRRSFRIISPVWRGRTGGRVIFEASLRRGVRKSLSLPHFKNNSIFSSLFVSDCLKFCTFAPAFRKECKRYIETTKRYARLANGNVRNFYCNARTVITVRAYSVDWLLHLHIKVIPTTSIRRRGKSAPRFITIKGSCGGWRA